MTPLSRVFAVPMTLKRGFAKSSQPSQDALLHAHMEGRRHQCLPAGTFREQHGVVPGIFNHILGGTGGSLDRIGGAAGDGGSQKLREHGFGGARLADEHQSPVARPG